VFNQLFIFEFRWGIAGSGIATTAAQALGLAYVLVVFLGAENRLRFRSHLTWRLHRPRLIKQFVLGFPMGLLYAGDLLGAALFQIMQVKLGSADGAATQIAMMLTSIAYLPGVGIALAGTTLVGQSIGAGDRAWAMRIGTRVIALAAFYMGGIGVLIALCGPWLLPFFTGAHDTESLIVIALGTKILWFAAAYQFFDGLNLGSGFCLRGAGDAVVPAALVLALSWLVFVPLSHIFTFAPGQGWVEGLPQLGWGVLGGWAALVIYVLLLGTMLFVRWRSGAWQRIRI
jgi:MATE family multidrug resistance protein